MDDFESHTSRFRATRRRRVFVDGRDDAERNFNAWREGIAACAASNPQGMALALERCKGRVQPISSRDSVRANACAKAVMALQGDPDAWARLRQGEWWRASDETPIEQWRPYGVDILSYFWAANPEGLAQAAKVWRQNYAKDPQTWSCPFLRQGYEGPIELSGVLAREARRLFPRLRRASQGDEAGGPPEGPLADMERQALASICSEAAKSSVLQLSRATERDARSRQEGRTVYERGGSEWGVRWIHSAFPARGSFDPPDSPLDVDIFAQALTELSSEALASSPEEGVAMARLITLALAPDHSATASLLGIPWTLVEAHPQARELPFPLGTFDWMRPAQLAELPVPDAKLGAWLAGPGASWSAPAQLGYRKDIQPAYPSWSYQARSNHLPEGDPHGLGDWTLLEWLLLNGRSGAVRAACLLGADLHPHFEEAIAEAPGPRGPKLDAVLASAEACRLASESGLAKPSPKAPRL